MKAVWHGHVLADSDSEDIIPLEGNYYFPPDSIDLEYFKPSQTHTVCPWKGRASYYHLEADGERLEDAAWSYPEPSELASEVKGYIAFYVERGIDIVD